MLLYPRVPYWDSFAKYAAAFSNRSRSCVTLTITHKYFVKGTTVIARSGDAATKQSNPGN